jgi:pimeloyl-ACP methyl ester carboxylesterase
LSQERLDQIYDNLIELRVLASDEDVFPPIDQDGVRGIRAPVLLVAGVESPFHLRVLVDGLEELIPNVERVDIPDASHLMHEDNPTALNQAILGFLGRHSDRPISPPSP